MKKHIYLRVLLLMAATWLVQSNCAVNKKIVLTNRYDVLKLGHLPVGLWVTPPDSFRNDAEYKKISDCGINFLNGFGYNENTPDKINSSLALCERYGLKYFVNKTNVDKAIKAYATDPDKKLLDTFIAGIKGYSNHPAFAGELLMDEPGKPLIPSVAAFTKRFEKEYPGKMWHVNLFPAYATGGIQTFSYEDYIDSWLKYTEPNYLSYDSYPLLKDAGIINDYFYNLDLVRSKTLERGIPFWTFIQTLSIAQTPGVPDKRDPSEADIRWQVWVNLAFGAKGIQYFCYWSPGSGAELFGAALIALDGKETAQYGYVKKLNADINKTGQILLGCDALGVIQTAKKPYPLYSPEIRSFGPVRKAEGDDHVIGCFKDRNGKFKVLVMPLTPDKGATVSLLLDKEVKSVTLVQGETVQRQKVRKGCLVQSIAAGNAVLIEF